MQIKSNLINFNKQVELFVNINITCKYWNKFMHQGFGAKKLSMKA